MTTLVSAVCSERCGVALLLGAVSVDDAAFDERGGDLSSEADDNGTGMALLLDLLTAPALPVDAAGF